MTDLPSILDKIVAVMQADPTLSKKIKKWHKVNGMVPGCTVGFSVGCNKIQYEEDTRAQDRATAELMLYFFVTETNAERGEAAAAALATQARYLLCQDYSLGGLLATSYVRGIEFVYADDARDLHAAALTLDAIFYAPRLPVPTAPPVGKI